MLYPVCVIGTQPPNHSLRKRIRTKRLAQQKCPPTPTPTTSKITIASMLSTAARTPPASNSRNRKWRKYHQQRQRRPKSNKTPNLPSAT
ncbi:DUF1613 domain-containing protein [Histoplasma capsulatum var. duboisii H88]|uniref:DUF1613 domain-containing protein n=1 Tax=Ajellomyces capsulatus (strain H88) TaxID=544711 RepID=A0A8A1LB61_AJEC8|nr:DUF1613 domain-containing protein [Histoplasma capsulatum var. duboisii H88]